MVCSRLDRWQSAQAFLPSEINRQGAKAECLHPSQIRVRQKMIVSWLPPSTILDVRIVLWAPEKRTNVRDRWCFGAAYIIPFYTCDCHVPVL